MTETMLDRVEEAVAAAVRDGLAGFVEHPGGLAAAVSAQVASEVRKTLDRDSRFVVRDDDDFAAASAAIDEYVKARRKRVADEWERNRRDGTERGRERMIPDRADAEVVGSPDASVPIGLRDDYDPSDGDLTASGIR